MNKDQLWIVCRSCGRRVLMHDMFPDNTGKNQICKECHRKNSPLRPLANTAFKPTNKPQDKKSDPMIKYICNNCKYKFSRARSKEVEVCPYCSKKNITAIDDMGANRLISESSEKRFDF